MLLFLCPPRGPPLGAPFSSGSGSRDGSPFRAGRALILLFLQSSKTSDTLREQLQHCGERYPKGQMHRTAAFAALCATIAAALRTTHRRALLLSPASLYPFAARAEPLPAGRKELYALVCAAAWPLNRAAGGR